MSFPAVFPDWVPWWVPLVVLLPALLYALAFLFMPFSVIGLKSRLDVMEARLDEIQNEIRHLSLRLPAPARPMDFDEGYIAQPPARAPDPVVSRPPIPPAPHDLKADRNYQEPRQAPLPRASNLAGARGAVPPPPPQDLDEDADHPMERQAPRGSRSGVMRPPMPPSPDEMDEDGDYPDDRPPPPPHTRPIRGRTEPQAPRPPRAEPRLHWPR